MTECELHDLFDGLTSDAGLEEIAAIRRRAAAAGLLAVFRQRFLQLRESGGSAWRMSDFRRGWSFVDLIRARFARRSGVLAAQMRRLYVHCIGPAKVPDDIAASFSSYVGAGCEHPVTVIIPVYNGYDALVRLTGTLFENTDAKHLILFIDDASTDGRIRPLLEEMESRHPNVKVMSNRVNCGFAGSVNRAVAACEGDFVLLNTDTQVPQKWIPRLFAPVWKYENTASVTPLTCESAFLSVPDAETGTVGFVEEHGVEAVDLAVSRIRPDERWNILEAGVGFCLAISRTAWNKVGEFDSSVFGRGYGEETDWCLRAYYKYGMVNRFAENLFVAHWHTASFKSEEKAALMARNEKRVKARNPRWRNEPAVFEKASLRRMWRTVQKACESAGLI